MKTKLLLSAATIAITTAISGPVSAADLPLKARSMGVAPQPVCTWCGWYAGGHLGYGWTKFEGHQVAGTTGVIEPYQVLKPSGLALGLHAGYNWQAGAWVFGIEGDGTITPWEKDGRILSGTGRADRAAWNSRLDWLASLRGRLGYAWGNTMLFVTGGVGFAAGRSYVNDDRTQAFENWQTVGGVVGGGIEQKVTPNASVRLEALHYFLEESATVGFNSGRIRAVNFVMNDVTVVRVGATWHFNPY